MVKREEISANIQDVDVDNPVMEFNTRRGRPKKTKMDVQYNRDSIHASEIRKYKIVYENARRRMYELYIRSLDEDMDARMYIKWMKRWKLYRSYFKHSVYNDMTYIITHPKYLDGRSKVSAKLFMDKMMTDSMMTPGF